MTLKEAGSDQELLNEIRSGVVLVDYGAPWCPPCRTLLPILDQLNQETNDQYRIVKVNCDELPESAAAAGVMSMPTVILYKDGQPVEKLVGLRPKAVYHNMLQKHAAAAAL